MALLCLVLKYCLCLYIYKILCFCCICPILSHVSVQFLAFLDLLSMTVEQMSLWSSISVRNTMLCLNVHPCLPFKVAVKLGLSTCQWRFLLYIKILFFVFFLYVTQIPLYDFVLQLCRIVECQRYTKKLNEQQVRSLLRATCQRPAVREGNVTKVRQFWMLIIIF